MARVEPRYFEERMPESISRTVSCGAKGTFVQYRLEQSRCGVVAHIKRPRLPEARSAQPAHQLGPAAHRVKGRCFRLSSATFLRASPGWRSQASQFSTYRPRTRFQLVGCTVTIVAPVGDRIKGARGHCAAVRWKSAAVQRTAGLTPGSGRSLRRPTTQKRTGRRSASG